MHFRITATRKAFVQVKSGVKTGGMVEEMISHSSRQADSDMNTQLMVRNHFGAAASERET